TQAAPTPGTEVRAHRSDEMMLQGQLDHLALGVHPKFAQDSLEMVAHSDIADPQGLGNLPCRLALYQKAKDLFFPRRQRHEEWRGLQGTLSQGWLRAEQLRRSTENLLNVGLIAQLACGVPKQMNSTYRSVARQRHNDADIQQNGGTRFRPPQHIIRGHGLLIPSGPQHWAVGLALVTAGTLFTTENLITGAAQHLVGPVACDPFGRDIPEHHPLRLVQGKDAIGRPCQDGQQLVHNAVLLHNTICHTAWPPSPRGLVQGSNHYMGYDPLSVRRRQSTDVWQRCKGLLQPCILGTLVDAIRTTPRGDVGWRLCPAKRDRQPCACALLAAREATV